MAHAEFIRVQRDALPLLQAVDCLPKGDVGGDVLGAVEDHPTATPGECSA
jgi:hypothetical protein